MKIVCQVYVNHRLHKEKNCIYMNFFLVILTALVILNPLVVYSKKTISDAGGFLDTTVEQTGIEKRDVNQTVGVVIKMVLGIVGSAFFILMVYAGFVWLTARGNEERVEKARKMDKKRLENFMQHHWVGNMDQLKISHDDKEILVQNKKGAKMNLCPKNFL